MPTCPTSVIEHLRTAVILHDGAALGDAELLGCFIEHRNEAALAALVERHGPMVWGVCRRLLSHHDAEAAFQAAFVVLVRKADSIAPREMVSNWLYGVALRTALQARRTAARRKASEVQVPRMPEAEARPDPWPDVRPLLDEELSRLPDHYRAVLVLCDLEGRTRKETAAQLGVPEGTVAGQLARAREMLARRLGRRGVTLSGAALAAVLSPGVTSAGLPPLVVSSTSVKVAALAAGVMNAMMLTKLKAALAAVLLLGFLTAGAAFLTARAEGSDPDRDGLSEFHERHKYRTDPNKNDTAGKGVPDGDWQQRREFTYSVRAVLRVMPPYNLAALTDDYQDVRVRKETKDYAELEVVVYPLNTNAAAIKGNPNWKKDYAGMKEYLAPGVTTNWDEAMRKDLLRELKEDGIDPDKLNDKEVVEQVSRWLFKRSKHRNMFCTFYVGFRDGKPVILPGLEKRFQDDKGDPKWTVQEQFEHELFGKGMFARKTYGTCTSTAVYQTTVLRALGIPTRMILCIPLADASDLSQVALIENGLTNHQVRLDACLGAIAGGHSFASHTFCEVFVGGRWRRLNDTKLGQNVLERNYLGLMIKVHSFKDLSDANLAGTWGVRYAKGQRDEVFKHSNPYRLMEVSDHFGKYAKVPNPPTDKELKQVTLGKAYWPESKDAPDEIRNLKWGKEPGSGQFFLHGEEWREDAGGYLQYKLFMLRSDRAFVLRAKGQPDVACRVSMNFYTNSKLRELEVLIPPADYARMVKGAAYTLHPANGKKGYEWKVREGVTLTRE